MKKYKFELTVKETCYIEVEANSYEEAEQKASEGDGEMTTGLDVETDIIRLIEGEL